ncbi:MAG: aldo/keto reductase [Myxococcales bacterium]|nr:aldo/keto reductase [Myxococcales bacterium]
MSEIGLGCWQLGGDFGPIDDARCQLILSEADTQGINFWDTADVYGAGKSEERIAQFTTSHSSKPIVATKVGRAAELYPSGYTKTSVRTNLENSLTRLQGEVLDLVQLHCIPSEVLKAGDILNWMDDFEQQGLIRYTGVSVETLDEALFAVEHPKIATIQTIFNLFRQDHIEQLFPKALGNNVGIIVRLPLASGVLAGTMRPDKVFDPSDHRNYNQNGAAFSVGETFSGLPFSKALEFVDTLKSHKPANMSMAQMAMRWILDQKAVSTVITGVSRPEQVRENASTSSLSSLPPSLHQTFKDFYFSSVKPHVRGVM